MHIIFVLLLLCIPSQTMSAYNGWTPFSGLPSFDITEAINPTKSENTFSMASESDRGWSLFSGLPSFDITKIIKPIEKDIPSIKAPSPTDSGYDSRSLSPTPSPIEFSTKTTRFPQETFDFWVKKIALGEMTIVEASQQSGIEKKPLKSASQNYCKKLDSALIAISNQEKSINMVHKELDLPITVVTNFLREKFGSKQFQLKTRFLTESATSFDEDIQAITDNTSPVRITWVIEKHKVEPKKVTDALRNFIQSKTEEKKHSLKKSLQQKNTNHRELGVLALQSIKNNRFSALHVE